MNSSGVMLVLNSISSASFQDPDARIISNHHPPCFPSNILDTSVKTGVIIQCCKKISL